MIFQAKRRQMQRQYVRQPEQAWVQGCDKGVGNMPGIPWPKDSEIWINFDAQLTGKFLFLCKDHLSEYIEGS